SRSPSPVPSPPSPSIARRQNVGGIFGTVQRQEKFLDVPVETTLAHLIGVDLDERVVPALSVCEKLERAECAGVGACPRGGHVLRETDAREKGVGRDKDVGGRNVTAIEM